MNVGKHTIRGFYGIAKKDKQPAVKCGPSVVQPLDVIMEERICGPLKMRDTGFKVSKDCQWVRLKAAGGVQDTMNLPRTHTIDIYILHCDVFAHIVVEQLVQDTHMILHTPPLHSLDFVKPHHDPHHTKN